MRPRLLLDMNLSPRWATFLCARGYEAQRWSEVGAPDAEDLEVLGYTARQGLVLVTHDLDFGTLLAQGRQERPSVVLLRDLDLRPEVSGERLVRVLSALEEVLATGVLVVVTPNRVRVRPLPL